MTYEEIVATLGFANSNERAVRIMTEGRQEVIGVPTSVDTHVTAHEVYLHPLEDDSTEIALSLGAIREVELL
ncbi:MAG TPA: hypothetical protein VG817_12880 [Gemmatimonadales bacterium]|nr:hypothetical protein [Gemmatimonadales bacterium]